MLFRTMCKVWTSGWTKQNGKVNMQDVNIFDANKIIAFPIEWFHF